MWYLYYLIVDMEVYPLNPLVSVCIPTYNNPNGLRNALACITGQSYEKLEIIVSDNCSPDPEVQEIIQGFAQQDKRITAFRQDPWVVVDLNFRFVQGKATGKYMMFAQDDDEWSHTFIEKLVEGLEANPDIPVAICPSQYMMANGRKSEIHKLNRLTPLSVIGNGDLSFVTMGLWKNGYVHKYAPNFPVQDVSKNIHAIYGEDHIMVAHIMMIFGKIVVVDSERYVKGFKVGGFKACFDDDRFYSFRSWYHLIKFLINSKHVPTQNKFLLPLVATTNFFRACCVTAVQLAVSLPEGNIIRKKVQQRYFGAN